ncbi:MAG: ABC transporter permease [Lachnospiraceae bacterium]|nr:ABC transporter permease [Lachnospiraceae bacterium]
MKTKLFAKELFGGMGKTIFFAIMTLISMFLICVLLTFTSERSYAKLSPNVIFSGQASRSFSRMYEDISPDFAKDLRSKLSKDSKIYQLTSRYSLSITRPGQLTGDDYIRYACEHEFLEEVMKEFIHEGRIPEKGKNEILVGGYLANTANIKVGDTISHIDFGKEVRGGLMYFDVTGEMTEIPYEVVGILDSAGAKFDYSVIFEAETQENTVPNVVWIYLPTKEAEESYRAITSSIKLSDYQVVGCSENLGMSGTKGTRRVMPVFVTVFAVVLEALLLAYAMKGLSRKLGILKALGLRDQYILSCYLGGVAIIQSTSSIFAVVVTKIICTIINSRFSKEIGFPISVYNVSFRIILLMLMITAVVLIAITGILKVRISSTSPKKAMIS